MSLLNRLVPTQRSSGGGVPERRYLDGGFGRGSSFIPPPGMDVAEGFVGEHKAMANLTVYACVRLLADTIASLPWKVYRRDANGVPKEINPTPKLFKQPYPGFDLFQWKWMVVAALALRGNSYHYVISRDANLYPTAVMPLHPDMVFVEPNYSAMDWMNPTYRIMGEPVNTADMIHVRRFTMAGEPLGLSPVRQAAVAIGLGLAAEDYGYHYFKDSANPSSVLETDEQLDDAAIRRQQQTWIASHGGKRRPAILSGGLKYKPISISPNESQFLETRKYQRSEISMMFGIPPHMIGDVEKETSWGTGIEQQSIGFVTYTLRPWLACIEQVFSDQLPGGQFVKFDVRDLLRGDVKARYEAYQLARNTGWLNADEIRNDEELPPIPGGKGKVYLQPVNYAPLGFDPSDKPPAAPPARPPTPAVTGDDGTKGQPPQGGKGNDGASTPPPRNGVAVK